MAEHPIRRDDEADLLRRAEALLGRHRGAPLVDVPALSDIPMLTDAIEPDAPKAEPPTLTDELPAPGAAPAPAPASGPPASGEVISRVQVQNLEHSVYQKLRHDLDERIAEVMQDR